MIDAVASKIIKKYLNDYLEDVGKNQLDMKIWKGDANLQDLVLKSTALTNNNVPLNVIKGILSKIHVRFPWKNLSKDPTIINISDVYILVSPDADTVIKADLQAADNAFHVGSTEDEKKADEVSSTLHNLINTVINNLQVDITNIHIRLEYSLKGANVCFGFVIPSIRVYSVDESGMEIHGPVKKGVIPKKNLDISRVSIYFDTADQPVDLENFTTVMKQKMSEEFHQFILPPFSIHANLEHNKGKDALFATIISTVVDNLHLSLDLMQCHTLILLNRAYANFLKARKFAHIEKPENTLSSAYFTYLAKCAIVKARPNEFNPKLALTVLKNRKQYLSFYREKHRKHKVIYLKKDLEHLEKKIGSEASAVLRRYSESIVNKEISYKEVTSKIDINELKKLVQTSDNVLQFESLQADFLIPKLEIELNLIKGEPLYKFIIEGLNGVVSNNKTQGFNNTLSAALVNAYSFPEDKRSASIRDANNIFSTKKPTIIINKASNKPLSIAVNIEPIIASMDIHSIRNLEYFTNVKDPRFSQPAATVTDVGQQLQIFKSLRTLGLKLNIANIKYTMPFIEHDQEKSVSFELAGFKVETKPQTMHERQDIFNLGADFCLKAINIHDSPLISKFEFSSNLQLVFVKDSFNVDIQFGAGINSCNINLANKTLESLKQALKYQNSVLASKSSDQQKKPPQQSTTNTSRISVTSNINIHDFTIDMFDADVLRTTLDFHELGINYNMTKNFALTEIAIIEMSADEYRKEMLRLKNNIISMSKDRVTVESPKPYIIFSPPWLRFIQRTIQKLQTINEPENKEEKKEEPKETKPAEPWVLEIKAKQPIVELLAADENIVLKMNGMTMTSGKETIISFDKIKGTRHETDFLSEVSFDIKQLATKTGYTTQIRIPKLDMNLGTDEYHAIMDVYYWYCDYMYVPDLPPWDYTVDYDISIQQINFGLYLFFSKFADCQANDLTITGYSKYGDLNSTVLIKNVIAKYTGYNQPLMTDVDNLKVSYKGHLKEAFCDITGSMKGLGVTRELYNFFVGIPFPPSNEPPMVIYPPYPINLSSTFDNMALALIDNGTNYSNVDLKQLKMTGVYDNGVKIDLAMLELAVKSMYIPDLSVMISSQLDMHYENFAIDLIFKDLLVNGSVPALKTFSDSLMSNFLWMNNPNHENVDYEDPGWIMGLSFATPSFTFNVLSNTLKSSLKVDITDMKACIKATQKHAGISIGSISTKYRDEEVLLITNIMSAISFIENDIPPPIETIFEEPHIYCLKGFNFGEYSATSSLDVFNLKYSHPFAQALIECMPVQEKAPAKQQNLSSSANSSETSSVVSSTPQKLSSFQPKAVLTINQISVEFFAYEPLAKLFISDVSAGLSTIWTATVGSIAIMPGNSEESYITCPVGKQFFKFEMKGDDYAISLHESEILMNFPFWLGLMSFAMRSPFLSVQTVSTDDGTKVEVAPTMSLKFHAPSLRLKIPARSKSGTKQFLNFHFNTSVKLAAGVLSVNVTQFTSHVNINKVNYPPIFENWSFSYENLTKANGKVSNKISMGEISWKISAADIILFHNIRSEIVETLNSLKFPMSSSTEQKETGMSYFKFNMGNAELILCRDNRSSTKYIPMFKILIPTMTFKLSTSTELNSMSVNIHPYITYFNETTGYFDQIMEPMDLNVIAALNEKSIDFMLKCAEIVNVNLPLGAVVQYLHLWDEIKNGMDGTCNCDDFPSFWISNRLGDNVTYVLNRNVAGKDNIHMLLMQEQEIPVYGVDTDCEISVTTEKNGTFSFTPSILMYPTLFNANTVVVKKPYKGGLMVELSTPAEIENKLNIILTVLVRMGSKFVQTAKIKPGERFALIWEKKNETSIIFVGEDTVEQSGHYSVIFSPKETNVLPFKIFHKKSQVFARRTSYIERSTGRMVFAIEPCCEISSFLPLPLQIVQAPNAGLMILQISNSEPDLYIDPDSKKAKLEISLDGDTFNPWLINLREKDPQIFSVLDPLTRKQVNLAVKVEPVKDFYIPIYIYSPVVVFNTIDRVLTIETIGKKGQNVRVDNRMFGMVCPMSYSDDKEVKACLYLDEKEKFKSEEINLLHTQNKSVFIPTDVENNFIPMRIDISQKDQSTVLTVSNFLDVTNHLPFTIGLQPILDIPETVGNEVEKYGLSKLLTMIGPATVVKSGKTVIIGNVTKTGCFMFSLLNYNSTPALCLSKRQRTVFKIQNGDAYYLVELNVVDDGCTYHAEFKPAKFPTAFVITNELPMPVSCYQLIPTNQFVVEPNSTSPFAFDEPYAYPNVNIVVGEKTLNISLIEDTGFVRLISSSAAQAYWVAVRLNNQGFRTVIITEKPHEEEEGYSVGVSFNFTGFSIAMIDELMREMFVLHLTDVVSYFDMWDRGTCLKLKINEMQLDDQHTFAETPNVLSGKKNGKFPFFESEFIFPPHCPLFTSFDYMRVTLQRIDANFDISFLADFWNTLSPILSELSFKVEPKLPVEQSSEQVKAHVGWLEISPVFIHTALRTSTSRPVETKPFPYSSFIPNITGVFEIPGVLLAQVSDTMSNIFDKISGDIKYHLFRQFIKMLGIYGKAIESVGASARIAESLGIKMENNMNDDTSKLAAHSHDVFENRANVAGVFAQETLEHISRRAMQFSAKPSVLITELTRFGRVDDLHLKRVGRGVFGVLTRQCTDPNVEPIVLKQKRYPRAFPLNRISEFSYDASAMQRRLQVAFKKETTNRAERIRILLNPTEDKFICITDTLMVVMNKSDVKKVTRVFLNQSKFEIKENTIVISTKKGNTVDIPCKDEEECVRINAFLNSQKIALEIFNRSLI